MNTESTWNSVVCLVADLVSSYYLWHYHYSPNAALASVAAVVVDLAQHKDCSMKEEEDLRIDRGYLVEEMTDRDLVAWEQY